MQQFLGLVYEIICLFVLKSEIVGNCRSHPLTKSCICKNIGGAWKILHNAFQLHKFCLDRWQREGSYLLLVFELAIKLVPASSFSGVFSPRPCLSSLLWPSLLSCIWQCNCIGALLIYCGSIILKINSVSHLYIEQLEFWFRFKFKGVFFLQLHLKKRRVISVLAAEGMNWWLTLWWQQASF